MPSDRARDTFNPSRKWRSLIAQQGRVTVEADFNEAMMISAAYRRQVVLEVVGPVGTPMSPAGYAVTVIGDDNAGIAGDLTIGAGALYVGGERLDLHEAVTYSSQPEWLDSSTDPSGLWTAAGPPYQTGSGYELVYLLAPEQEVSAVEDPALADVALGGPDTMQRSRILQRFVRQTIGAAPDSSTSPTDWWTLLTGSASTSVFGGLTLDSTGTLLLSTTTLEVSFAGGEPADPGPAGPGITAGYLGAENQLIRVMVLPTAAPAEGGPPPPSIVWGFDDASFVYRVQSLSYDAETNATAVMLASAPVDSYHQPVVGQSVELLRDAVALDAGDYIASATGYVAGVVTAYDPATLTLAIAGSPPADYLPAALTTPPPTVAAVSPCVGVPAGGTSVTVIGSGFTGATQVTFGANAAANLIVLNDTQLTVTSPAGVASTPPASPQPVQVQVTTPAGSSPPGTDLADFTYVAPGAPTFAAVSPVSPSSGVPAGGTLVTIAGTGFTATTTVEFGSTPGLGLVIVNDNQLTVLTPPATDPGTVGVTVITTVLEATAAGAFEYVTTATAQVTAVTPSTGGPQVQTAVTVTGSGFTGATGVNFGEIAATEFSVVSDTELTAVSPAPGATGAVDVLVTTAAGTSSPNPPSDQFTYAIGVTGLTPSSGPLLGGTEVAVTGIGLSGASSVLFGATAASEFSVVSDTALTVIAPPGTGTMDVTVTTAAGATGTVPADRFVYQPTPQPYLRVWQGLGGAATVASSAPANSYAFALEGTGAIVTLRSPSGWFHGGDFWRFALRPLAPESVDPQRYLDAGQPPDGPRTLICPLAVLDWAGGTATVQTLVPQFGDLTYLTELVLQHITVPAPTVTSLSPAVGSPSGGTLVTVTGTGFTGATAVSFGDLLGTGVKVISDTQLTVTSPAQSVDTVGVTVTAPTGTSAAGTQFGYVAITGVSPAVGLPTGGTPVTLTGSGFADATAAHFGGTPGTGFAVTSDTEITVTSPAGTGLVDITVSVPLGTSPTGPADSFLYGEVTSLQPPSGPSSGGTQVTINGSGFAALPITGVTFGSASVGATVSADSALTVFTPATGTPGEVTVTVATQLGALPVTNPQASNFQYTGKTLIKDAVDTKNLTDGSKNIRDKAVRDTKVALLEKTREVLMTPSKAAEAKPAETTVTGVGLKEAADPADTTEAGTTEAGTGQAFIAPEQRPAVGDELLNDNG